MTATTTSRTTVPGAEVDTSRLACATSSGILPNPTGVNNALKRYLNFETRSACSRMTLALSLAAVPVGSPLYLTLGFDQ